MVGMTARWPALVVLVTALAALLGTGPAFAERATVNDATGDVWSPEGPRGWTHEGSVVNTDLRRTVFDFSQSQLSVTATYVNLKKNASDEINLDLLLRTDTGRLITVAVSTDWQFQSTSVALGDRDTAEVIDCEGATGSASAGSDVLRFAIPRSCLGDPAWIRFQGNANSFSESSAPYGLFRDDIRTARPPTQRWSHRLDAG
jgi:hypothetical protein